MYTEDASGLLQVGRIIGIDDLSIYRFTERLVNNFISLFYGTLNAELMVNEIKKDNTILYFRVVFIL